MNPISALTLSLLEVLHVVITLYIWALVISAALTWLIAFNIVNSRSSFVQNLGNFLFRITEPALRPIRRVVKPINGIDFSPFILILVLWFLQSFLYHLVLG